ncbi:MAG: LamG-like jellyroll fold domain-containing protein [Cyclobacteriaceae bacterium]
MKKLFTLALFLILNHLSFGQATPVSEYLFTNGSLLNSESTTNNLTSTGNNLTSVADRDGFADNAISLNGDVLQEQSGVTRTNFSVSFWMKTSTNDSSPRYIIDQWGGNPGGKGAIGYRIYMEDGELHAVGKFYVFNQNIHFVSANIGTAGGTIADGQWHHVVLTMSAWSRSTLNGNFPNVSHRLYVDNVMKQLTTVEISTGGGTGRTVDAVPLSVGNIQDLSAAANYTDEIDDIRFYSSKLTDEEVATIYAQRTSKAKIHVKSDAAGNNDGSSWTDAFTDLKTATEHATAAGDEIWVAQGTYKPDASDRTAFFTLKNGVKLYGGFDGTETEVNERDWINNPTILSGDLSDNDDQVVTYTNTLRNDNSYRIVYVEGSDVVIDGVTITSGQANNTANNEYNRGAAIYKNSSASNLTIRNTTLSKNVSNREGNVHAPFTGEENELLIENCIVYNNFARYGGGFIATVSDGATLNAKVYNSLFHSNVAGNISANDGFSGSSIFFGANEGRIDLTVINSTFTENEDLGTSASNDKGTILIRRLNDDGSSVVHATFHNNIFYNNLSSTEVVNEQAIGLFNRASNKLNSLTFTHNISNQTDFTTKATLATVTDNINQDPLFTDAISQDFTLFTGSPAIDAGSNDQLPDDLFGDILGNRRIHAGTIDMGAYESGSTARNTVAPTAIAQDITVQLGINGEVTIAASQLNNGSTDDDTPDNELVFSLDKTTFTCEDLGDNTVTLTVKDASRNIATTTAIVTVTSNINDETITIAEDTSCGDASTTVSTGSSVSGINYFLRNSADNSILDGPVVGTGEALDFNTGSISDNTTFNVYGEVPPVNSISGGLDFDGTNDRIATTYTMSTTHTFTLEAWVFPRGTSWNRLFSNMNYSSLGSTAGDFIVDTYGSPDNGRNVRFILDGETSDIQLYADQVLTLNEWNHVAVTFDNGLAKILVNGVEVASENNSAVTRILGSSRPTHFGVHGGASPVRYFDGKMDEVRIWNVAKTATEISASMNECLRGTESGLSAYFNFEDGEETTLTEMVAGKNGTLVNFDEATAWAEGPELACGAGCGLQMSNEVNLAVGDLIPPIVNTQNATILLNPNGVATVTAAMINNESSDNCSTELTFSLSKTTFSCNDLGDQIVTLTVTDESGNQSTADATVTVEDRLVPSIFFQNLVVELDDTGHATVDPSSVNTSSFDHCGGELLFELSQTEFDCTHLGTNEITFTATDQSGNAAWRSVSITIEESAPTIVTQDITVALDANGMATITPADINNGTTDDCTASEALVLSLDVVDFSCENVGSTNIVTLTATDLNEHSSTNTAIVTVVDTMIPVVITKDISIVLDANGNAAITVTDINNGSTDNCTDTESLTYSLDITSFDINNVGANTVTLSVTDASGNVGTATATVNVADKPLQVVSFSGNSDKTFGDDNFDITATTDSSLPVSFAVISGGLSITQSEAGSATFEITGAGTALIAVTNDGSDDYAPLNETITINIAKAEQTLAIDEVPTKTVAAAPVAINATVSTSLALSYAVSGPATIADNIVTLDGTIGTVQVTVSQAGNDNYNSVSESISFEVVEQQTQTIDFTDIPDLIYGAADQTLTASASSNLAVSFTLISGPAMLNGNILSITGAGDIVVEAVQSGDVDFQAASAQQTITVAKAEQVLTIDEISTKPVTASPVTINASVSSNLTLSYAVSGPATIADNIVTLDGTIGTVQVTVSQAGNNNYNAVSASVSFAVVEKQEQTISFTDIPDLIYGASAQTLAATASSNQAVSFSLISGPGSLSGSILSITGVGEIVVEATQAGNDNFFAASSQQSFTVSKASLNVSADDQTIVYGESIPTLTLQYAGLVNGDSETSLITVPAISTTATASSDAGVYPITVSGGSADNYTFNYVGAELTILKAAATITLSDLEQEVDGSAKTPTIVTSPADLSTTITYNGETAAPTAVGIYQVVVTIDDVNHEGSASGVFELIEPVLSHSQEITFEVYPNPTSDFVLVQSPLSEPTYILDLEGRTVLKSMTNRKIDVSSLSPGIYMIISGNMSERLIKR